MSAARCCSCGQPTDGGSVDLLAAICHACVEEFQDWCDANPGALYSTWPGLAVTQ